MKYSFFLLIILVQSLCNTSNTWAQGSFPQKCEGVWEGMMQIYSQGVLIDSVAVRFTVAPKEKSIWIWKTEYLSEKLPMTKDYTLRSRDSLNTVYITDEGNGIELYEYLFGNKLYAVFETENILLTSSYELRNEQELIFEVTSGKKLPASPESSRITSYSTDSLQRVVLKKRR